MSLRVWSLTLVNRGKADFDLGGKFGGGLDVAADLVEPEERNRGFNGDWENGKVAQGGRAPHVLFVALSGPRGYEQMTSVLRGGGSWIILEERKGSCVISINSDKGEGDQK